MGIHLSPNWKMETMPWKFRETFLDENLLIFVCVWDILIMLLVMSRSREKKLETSSRIRTIFRHLLKSLFTRENNYKTNTLTMKITNTF
jgi:hypothetical protein